VSKSVLKLFVGLLTATPMLFFVLLFLGLVEAFYAGVVRGSWDYMMYRWVSFPTLVHMSLFMTVWCLVLTASYIIHIATNHRLRNENKIAWGLLIVAGGLFSVVGGLFSMAVYWYVNIWREPRFAKHGMF
jgi:hypothetical protein